MRYRWFKAENKKGRKKGSLRQRCKSMDPQKPKLHSLSRLSRSFVEKLNEYDGELSVFVVKAIFDLFERTVNTPVRYAINLLLSNKGNQDSEDSSLV